MLVLILFLAALTGAAQAPTPLFADIVACADARTCKNMQPETTNWYDVVRIPVLTFTDGESGFSIAAPRTGGLSVWIRMPGESRPSRLLTLSADNHILSAELGPMPGDSSPRQRTPAETEAWRSNHKAYSSGESSSRAPVGQEFKAFWEEQAKQAMAAIRRQMAK